MTIDRRALMSAAMWGSAGLLMPGGRAFAQLLVSTLGFTHGVASGEPASDSMLCWTRFVGTGSDARVTVELCADPGFARIAGAAATTTGPWRDWTVKLTVDGLRPATDYWYRFIGPDGTRSPVGRTRTLPEGRARRFSLGVFSCSNLPFGHFNAYAHAAAGGLDAWMHLGDYLYEARRGIYPSEEEAVRMDWLRPDHELIALADYRTRYAAYRSDPDLQALHARAPMIASMDDHESANDAWEGGAQAHQAEEGWWHIRRAAAEQAYREWMPIDDLPYKTYRVGTLATLYRTETRLSARSAPPDLRALLEGGTSGLAAFRDGAWTDPAATMMGTAQESWLYRTIREGARTGVAWHVIGSGTAMGRAIQPPTAADWVAPDAPERNRRWVANGIAAGRAGLPSNLDSWGGYPAARDRLLRAIQHAGADAIIVSGDTHNGWAFDLPVDGRPAAVECAGHSVTSPGFESATRGTRSETMVAALRASSPELRWADIARRGYMRLTLTPGAATNEWVFVDTVATRSLATQPTHAMRVRRGRHRFD